MNRIKFGFGLIAFLAFSTQINANFVDVTQGYNVVTFGDFYDYQDQTHGKIAVKGNATFENSFGANVDASLNTKQDAIVSAGNVRVSGNGEVHGSIRAGGNVTVSCATVTGDVYAKNITMEHYDIRGTMNFTESVSTPYGKTNKLDALPELPINFTETQNAAEDLSKQLSLNGNDYYQIVSGTLYLNTNAGNEVSFFNINASDLSSITSLHIDNLSKECVINVNGNNGEINLKSIDAMNYKSKDSLNFSNILFNFVNTASLKIGSFYGNILAPETNITADNGQMIGCMVANSVSGSYEYHKTTPGGFNPPPHSVPEASTVSMLAAGMFCLLLIKRTRFANK